MAKEHWEKTGQHRKNTREGEDSELRGSTLGGMPRMKILLNALKLQISSLAAAGSPAVLSTTSRACVCVLLLFISSCLSV